MAYSWHIDGTGGLEDWLSYVSIKSFGDATDI
jgi:hypothetical protein